MSALKLVLSCGLLVFSFFTFTYPAFAADSEPLTSKNYNYLIHGQTTIEGSMGHTAFCSILGWSPINGKEGKCSGYDSESGSPMVYKGLPTGGALGALGGTMVALYNNPPTSSVYYLANLGENMGLSIINPAYAQVGGSGQGILEPVLKLWTAIRNIVYLIFIFIFLVVGVMLMLRQKISPQAVISIQAALPSLVIGLILVTFSYFIAALLVDLMFVGLQLVVHIFSTAGLPRAFGEPADIAQKGNVIQLFGTAGFRNLGTIYSGSFEQIVNSLGGGVLATEGITGLLGTIGGGLAVGFTFWPLLLGGGAGLAAPFVIPVIIIIILLIALLIQMFRLLFGLIGSYIQILIFTIMGPLYILFGSIPGRSGAISSWMKGILANALVFPAVLGAFLFAGMVLGTDFKNFNTTLPMFGEVSSNFIKVLIAYGILLGTPSIPDMVRKALGVSGPQGFAQAAMGGFMAGVGVGRAGATKGWNTAMGSTNAMRAAYQDQSAKYAAGVPEVKSPTVRAEVGRFRRWWIERGAPHR